MGEDRLIEVGEDWSIRRDSPQQSYRVWDMYGGREECEEGIQYWEGYIEKPCFRGCEQWDNEQTVHPEEIVEEHVGPDRLWYAIDRCQR